MKSLLTLKFSSHIRFSRNLGINMPEQQILEIENFCSDFKKREVNVSRENSLLKSVFLKKEK